VPLRMAHVYRPKKLPMPGWAFKKKI